MKDKDWVLSQSFKSLQRQLIIPNENFLVSLKQPTLPSPCLYTSRVLPLNRRSFLPSELENTIKKPAIEGMQGLHVWTIFLSGDAHCTWLLCLTLKKKNHSPTYMYLSATTFLMA